MLPEATAKAGYCVFRTNCEPNQKPMTIKMTKITIAAVLKYSFFHNSLSFAVDKCLSFYVCGVNVPVDLGFRVIKLNAF
jgi:hypothetical protein